MPTYPNMNLIYPDVSSTPGPTWASLLNAAGALLDAHDHTSGKGVTVPSAGININADLSFNSFNATTLRSTRYDNQLSLFSSASDNRSFFVFGGEAYFRDNVGNNVKITNAGAVNVSGSNGIGGDYGGANPASVFYTDATDLYSFTTDPGVFANLKYRGLELTGKIVFPVTNIASSPTIGSGASDTNTILMVNTSSARNITLPDPALEKRVLIFKDYPGTAHTNPITLIRNGAEKIDNKAESLVINESYAGVALISDGTDWQTILDTRQSPSQAWLTGANQNVPTNAAGYGQVTIGTSNYAHGITLSANRLTFASPGLYEIEFSAIGLGFTNNTTGNNRATADLAFYNVTGAAIHTQMQDIFISAETAIADVSRKNQSSKVWVSLSTADLANTYEFQWRQSLTNIAVDASQGVQVYIRKIARN